ncbi:MAG: carotenoid biosynthesis protein [Candidatus Dormibacteria bacterium]
MAPLLDRWYTFLPWIVVLVLLGREVGWRRALAVAAGGWLMAFAAEWSSTSGPGIPFGVYHYRAAGLSQDWRVLGVPVFDSISFTWLSVCTYVLCGRLGARGPWRLLLAAVAVVAVDVVVDPVALKGGRWWLGSIYSYPPHVGVWYGVSALNYSGWFVVALAQELWLGFWLFGSRRPEWPLLWASGLLILGAMLQSAVLAVILGVGPSALLAVAMLVALGLIAHGPPWPSRSAPPLILIACALASEAGAVRHALGGSWVARQMAAGQLRWRSASQPLLEVWQTGMGGAAATIAATLAPPGSAVLVCGVGGACGPDWPVAATGIASQVFDEELGWCQLDPTAHERLVLSRVGRSARLASLLAPKDGKAGREAMAALGVDLVEMETAAWLRACEKRGGRLLAAVRTVIDTPARPLGLALGLVPSGAAGPSPRRVAALLLRHPFSVLRLLTLSRQQSLALAALGEAVRRAVPVLVGLAAGAGSQGQMRLADEPPPLAVS